MGTNPEEIYLKMILKREDLVQKEELERGAPLHPSPLPPSLPRSLICTEAAQHTASMSTKESSGNYL